MFRPDIVPRSYLNRKFGPDIVPATGVVLAIVVFFVVVVVFRPDIVPATGAAVQEVLDAAVPTHPAKCVFIVIKKLVMILVMIKSVVAKS